MQPADRVEPRDWMRRPATGAVLAAVGAAGRPARFVGGCVRDSLLGRDVRDIDIATAEPPDRVMRLLAEAGIKVLPVGLDHGTVMAVVEGEHFEITTLRVDVETFGRRAKVAFTDDWRADAERRDFTMNALYLDADGTLYDPVDGLSDLRAGRVRFVGDAAQRIEEDYLRILRFFRFHAHYGRAAIDRQGLAACRRLAGGLARLSGERVRAELLRLLAAPAPAPVVEVMAESGVLAVVLPEATRIARLGGLVRVEPEADAVRRLAALVEGDAAAMRGVAERLRLSNAERDRLIAAAEPLGADDAAAARRLIYGIGTAAFRDRVLLAWAENPASDAYRPLLDLGAAWPAPKFSLKGRDAVKRGVPRGPRVGELIAAVEDWWIAGDFQADRAACLKRLEDLI